MYLPSYPLQVRQKWEEAVGPISEQHWEYVLGLTPQLSPSEAQRFSQLLLLHRVYKSPAMLHRIRVRPDSCCPRCSLDKMRIYCICSGSAKSWAGSGSHIPVTSCAADCWSQVLYFGYFRGSRSRISCPSWNFPYAVSSQEIGVPSLAPTLPAYHLVISHQNKILLLD